MRRNRVVAGSLAVILIVVIAVALAAAFIARSSSFHHYVLSKIIDGLSKATGARVDIAAYRFRWSPLGMDLFGITVHGTEAKSERPLAAVDRLGVDLKIVSILRRKVDLNAIALERPVVHVLVAGDGRTNVPEPKASKQNTKPTDVFDLAVKDFRIQRGEIFYNDRQIQLDAELHQLESRIQFAGLRNQYEGSVGYRQGRLRFGDWNTIEHDIEAKFSASRSRLTIEQLAVSSGSSRMIVEAALDNYVQPTIHAVYKAAISGRDVGQALRNAALPSGDIRFEGTVDYQDVPNRRFLDSVSAKLDLNSSSLKLRWAQAFADIRAVRGHFKLEKGNLETSWLEADLLGGHLSAALAAQGLSNQPRFRMEGGIRSVSLDAVSAALGLDQLREASFGAHIDATAKATWQGDFENLQVGSDATITASLNSARPSARPAAIPVNGAVHLSYDRARGILSLARSSVRTPHTVLLLDGVLGQSSSLNLAVRSDDLHEIDLVALAVRRATTAGPPQDSKPQPLGLYGSSQFEGKIEGSVKEPRLHGDLSARDVQFQNGGWRSIRAAIDVSPHAVRLRHGELIASTNGKVSCDADVALSNWSYTPSSPVGVSLTVTAMPVRDILRLANARYPVDGTLSGHVGLEGTRLHPKGTGSIEVAGAVLWNEPIRTLTVDFKGTGESLNVKARAALGKVSGEATYYPQNQGYELAFDIRSVKLEGLENVRSRNLPLTGVITVGIQGRGKLTSPELEARVDVPELGLGQATMREFKARAGIAANKAHLELTSAVADAFIQAESTVDLDANYYTSATLETRGLPLGPFLGMYVPGQRNAIGGELDLRASLRGPLKQPGLLTAGIDIPKFRAGYEAMEISNAGPIRIDYRNSVLEIGQARFRGTGTEIELQGAIPLAGSSPLAFSARAKVDLKLLTVLNRQTESAGQILLDIRAGGDRSRPDVAGDIHVVDAAFSTPTTPLGVEKVNGDIAVRGHRAEITKLTALAGGGSLSVQGFVQYRPEVQFKLGVTGKSVRLRYPEGLRAILDSNLLLTGTPSSSNLSGTVLIDRLSFTKEFDLATFMSQFGTESSPPPSSGFAQNMNLDVGIGSAGELGLTSSKVSFKGQADLRVRGTAANPIILGRASVSDGDLFFLNHRYHVERGVVTFANPARTEPVINVLATTKVNEYKLSLNLVGPIEQLRTNYVSDPPLPAVDIINLLARGKTTEAATPGSMGANTLLAQGLAGQVSNRVEKLAGLSSLQIDPLIGGNNRNPSARLAVQERVTKDILFTYATDVTSTQNVLVQIEYQLTPGWSVNVTRDENGNVSIQGRRHKNF